MIARNEFATYLHRRMTLSKSNDWSPEVDTPPTSTTEGAVKSASEDEDVNSRRLLPPPIDDARSCKWCYVSDACMLFRKVRRGYVLRALELPLTSTLTVR